MDSHLKNFITYLDVERGFSKNTLAAYRTHLSRFILYAKDRQIYTVHEINHKLLDDFLMHLRKQGIGQSSQRLFMYAMRTFLHFLVYDDVLKTNFLKYMHVPKVLPSVMESLTTEEIKLLFKQPDLSTAKGACYLAVMELLYGSGLRISEACNLKISDMHEDLIKVLGKGNKERIVPLSASFLEALYYYWENFRIPETLTPHHFIFTNKGVLPVNRHKINDALKKYTERCGISKNVTPHILRHSFATHLLMGGMPYSLVQEFLGHSQLETTSRYTHVEFNSVVESFEKFHPRFDIQELNNDLNNSNTDNKS